MSRFVRIQTEEICLEEIIREMTAPECGAVLAFYGVVRNHADGKEVDHIDYHCYEAMAEKELAKVLDDCLKRCGVDHGAIIHRYGTLAIGERSLGVVVASPHRREAFECGLMIIEEIKKTVPVWKKEFGPDGSHWV